MSDADDTPRWDLLPDDPLGFFALGADYDRTGLKRAYNRYIRRFRPEKCPAEFMKIRAAYEELDARLRYGFDPDETPAAEEARAPTQPPPRPRALARLAEEPPETLYASLRASGSRSPSDYATLAVLSDLVQGDHGFASWLVEGIAAHPRDGPLVHLLYEYCRNGVRPEERRDVLLVASRGLAEDVFYSCTEPLWDQVLADAPFDEFKDLLAECERSLPRGTGTCRAIFYVHVLRRAYLKADDEWLAEKTAFVEEHYETIGEFLERDLVFLDLLEPYRARRPDRASSHVHDAIDRAIRAYCEDDRRVADREFLRLQLVIRDAGDGLAKAVRPRDKGGRAFLDAYRWIADEVAERVDPPSNELGETRARTRATEFMNRLERLTRRSVTGMAWYVSSALMAFFVVFLILLLPVYVIDGILRRVSDSWDGSGGFFLVLIPVFIYANRAVKFLRPRLISPMRRRIAKAFSGILYRRLWRKELLAFIRQTGMSVRQLVFLWSTFRDRAVSVSGWVAAHTMQDPAPELLSTSMRFVS